MWLWTLRSPWICIWQVGGPRRAHVSVVSLNPKAGKDWGPSSKQWSNRSSAQRERSTHIKNVITLLSLLILIQMFLFLFLLFSCSVVSDSLRPHGLQHTRLPCPSPYPRACSNSCPWSQWCHPTISSCHPLFLLPSIFPSISLFQWVGSLHQVAKVLQLQLQHQSFQWIFRTDFL